MGLDFLATGLLWYVVFLFSTVCHEAAHALVAKRGGDLTAYAGGQVTLDPIPHIKREPFGLVFIPLLCLLSSGGNSLIGWGSAPFDPFWQIRYPRRAALMALAGPLTNFAIAFVAAIVIHVGLFSGVFAFGQQSFITSPAGGLWEAAAIFLTALFFLNCILGAFNLLPFPPLDGYSVLGLFLPEQTFLKLIELSRTPIFSILGLLVAFKLFPIVSKPILQAAMHLFMLPFL